VGRDHRKPADLERDQPIADRLDAADLRGAATVALRMYGPAILQYLRSVLGEEDIAYEVFSEFCEDLWTALPRFRREASFRTWAYKLAWTAAQDWRRRAARNRVRRLGTDEISRIIAEVRSVTPLHERTDSQNRWKEILDALGAADRSLLMLRVDQRMSWVEVAEAMTRMGSAPDPAALRKRFERLKTRLRALGAEHGLRAEEDRA
jgi:RNA polymerase sigma-70 factor, ECF subfamily